MKIKITMDIEVEVAGEEAPKEEIKESIESAFLHDAPNIITVNDNCDLVIHSTEVETEIYE